MWPKGPQPCQIDDVIENRTCDLKATNHAVILSLEDLTRHGQDTPFCALPLGQATHSVDGEATARSTYVVRDEHH